MKKQWLYWGVAAFMALPLHAQEKIVRPGWELNISDNGCLEQLIFKNGYVRDTVPFFHKESNRGPRYYVSTNDSVRKADWTSLGNYTYRACLDSVECMMTYRDFNGQPAIELTMTNRGVVPFQPQKAGIRLGVDTYMDKYPDWFGKYFPTLMRNEKTHFYGYMQTPGGHILALASEQPVASWSVDYNLGYMDPPPHWFMGHRIESLNLDLMNALPLPAHHPQECWQLLPGESRKWLISLIDGGNDLNGLESAIHQVADIPLVKLDKTSYEPGETASFTVYGAKPSVVICTPKGGELPMQCSESGRNQFLFTVSLPEAGLYKALVIDGDKESEMILDVHAPWQKVMEQARQNVLRYHQKATSHAESWYGFYPAFIAARYFPDKSLDEQAVRRFDYLYNRLHDPVKGEPLYHASRIQNTSTTIGMLVDKFEAFGHTGDLEKASGLADWLISHWQREDGAYCNHGTVYTSVIYVAKSILELVEVERRQPGRRWQKAATRHYASAKRAIDQLVRSQGDFETEGEMTFEDGMVSCSALQIGMLALMQEKATEREKYTKVLLGLLDSHDCLTQLRVPDARRRQGTMRYWEAQYDVQMLPNMFNSPHGWSGWRAYATYYAYLLTGDEKWLLQTFNAMGAFANLIDSETGQLRWAFVVDPYLKVEQTCGPDTKLTADSLSFGNPHPRLYPTKRFVIGEQYVNMVSDWQTVNTQDNDVHEVFKCMGETVLTNAFIVERADGTVAGYNCKVVQKGNHLQVSANEKQMEHLHANLKGSYVVHFLGKEKKLKKDYLGWVNL